MISERENKEKIERYISGQADEKELAWIDNLFLDGEENEVLRESLKKDWCKMVSDESVSDVNLDAILDRVHHIIGKNENFKRQKPIQRFLRIYMKVAAILLIPLLIAFLGYKFLENKTASEKPVISSIYAPMGARVSFNLPDGTKGMLNSGSTLSYSVPFNSNRQVNLDGEAWFDVCHDDNHPFEINSGTSTVKVYGTRFNMSAYPEESFVEVVLEEGKVSYRNNEVPKEVNLLPSERLIFRNGNVSKSITDPAKYNAWTQGKLVFRGDPMAEVARRIERWYNVKVNMADKELNRYSFRGIFLDDSLEDVLKFLCMTSPIRYTISPRELLNDGTYKKEEVTIYLK
jgi:transmembrane sensor